MKSRQAIRALAGVLLCGLGLWLAVPTPYREKTYLVDAGGCRMETTVTEKSAEASQGSVVLFHGISANKKIMSYLARGFAEQNLRVYVPDFPGHGRTPGPFSPEPESMRGNGADLFASNRDGSSKYVEVPGATHVSVLFSAATVQASQEWSAQILHLVRTTRLPSHGPLLGALAGFLGLLLITGPFLREAAGRKPTEEILATGAIITDRRLFLEWAASSSLIVVILRLWNPLKVIRVFQGDYLASFLLLL